LDPAALYLFAAPGTEARGRAPIWDECLRFRAANCLEVVASTPKTATISSVTGGSIEVPLNDDEAVKRIFASARSAYLDISGLPHHVWAPLLRAGLEAFERLWAVYAEPAVYRRHPSPTSKTEFDLSAGFRGVEPIPGFAKLRGPGDEKESVLVALLGFEGRRATNVAFELDPVPNVFAIVGVPGFRIEYPQYAYSSNEEFLAEFRAYANVRFAGASCPFEAYDALVDIARDTGAQYMYIAPIGTKPHALGAVCYAIKHSDKTELMYDHPVRKAGRTQGIGTLHIYAIKPSYVAP
jgi:hypothetical protein